MGSEYRVVRRGIDGSDLGSVRFGHRPSLKEMVIASGPNIDTEVERRRDGGEWEKCNPDAWIEEQKPARSIDQEREEVGDVNDRGLLDYAGIYEDVHYD